MFTFPSIKFNGYPQSGSGADTCGQTDGWEGYLAFSRLCERTQKLTKPTNRVVRSEMYRRLNSFQFTYCVLG